MWIMIGEMEDMRGGLIIIASAQKQAVRDGHC